MAEAMLQGQTAGERANKRATIQECLAEIDRLRGEMKADQAEIGRLTLEIRANFSDTDAILDRLAAA